MTPYHRQPIHPPSFTSSSASARRRSGSAKKQQGPVPRQVIYTAAAGPRIVPRHLWIKDRHPREAEEEPQLANTRPAGLCRRAPTVAMLCHRQINMIHADR